MITGAANCGKTFILKPLTLIYDTLSNPASGSFAWVGVQKKEWIFFNDFRLSPQLIPWHDLLLMLEGELVYLPAPKTHFSKHIQLVRDTPIFCTTKRPLLYVIDGGVGGGAFLSTNDSVFVIVVIAVSKSKTIIFSTIL